MLYIATIMAVLGVLCFIYIYFKPTQVKTKAKKQSTVRFRSLSKQDQQYDVLRQNLFNYKYPNVKYNQEVETRLRSEREIHNFPSEKVLNPQMNLIENDEDTLTKIEEKTQKFEEILKEERDSLKNETIRSFVTDGVLYLDFGRKIPFEDRNFRSMEWKEDMFTEFKRVGEVKLLHSENSFDFELDTKIYHYSVDELEQIVFFDEVFCLIPSNNTSPAPVLFTKNTSEFKKYLKSKAV